MHIGACVMVAALFPGAGWAGSPPASAAEVLKKCEARYAEAKTYEDSGEVTTEFTAAGRPVKDMKSFSTAFERGGRFLWQFRHSVQPGGKQDHRFVVWSADQKSFKSSWTLHNDLPKETDSIGSALAAPTGISGGATMAVMPLLLPDIGWGGRPSSLKGIAEQSPETIDGVRCSVITGQNAVGGAVTLWLDASLAIRRIRTVQEIDPAKLRDGAAGEKFVSTTTISITPVFDGDIADEKFVAPVK
ncbi:MAG: hypothetical protein IT436_14330 [Phycisphaerales bacterium]|nr:hypothetical protein [Phycisphaerales bacterium]